tara:strand:+ start:441 stop:1679 length:1239 start_codon:yes stop_codon:yes gene_type:complete
MSDSASWADQVDDQHNSDEYSNASTDQTERVDNTDVGSTSSADPTESVNNSQLLHAFNQNCQDILTWWSEHLDEVLEDYLLMYDVIVRKDDPKDENNDIVMGDREAALAEWKSQFGDRLVFYKVDLPNSTNAETEEIEIFSFAEWIEIAKQDPPHKRDEVLWNLFFQCLPNALKDNEELKILDIDSVQENERLTREKRVSALAWDVFFGIQKSIDNFLVEYMKKVSISAKTNFEFNSSRKVMKEDFGLMNMNLMYRTSNDKNGGIHSLKSILIDQLIKIWNQIKENATKTKNPDHLDMTKLNYTGNDINDNANFEIWKRWTKQNRRMLRIPKEVQIQPHTVRLVYKRLLYLFLKQMVLRHIKKWDLNPFDENGNSLDEGVLKRKLEENCNTMTYAAPFPSSISVCSRFAVVL